MKNFPSDFGAIATLDLDPIKVKLMHRESGEDWSLERVNAVEAEYRRFLYLMKEFPNELAAPCFDVDIFWHYHILDTVKYAQDCETVFGYFLHHFPYLGLRGEEDLETHHRVGERMRELYEETFGEPYLREVELAAAGTVLSAGTAATAYSVRTPGSVAATDTAYSVRAPRSIAATDTAYSVRAPHSIAPTDTAYSVRAPHSIAATDTAYSVRAPHSIAATDTAYSVRAPAATKAPTAPRHVEESAVFELEPTLVAFYSNRPRLGMAGATHRAQ